MANVYTSFIAVPFVRRDKRQGAGSGGSISFGSGGTTVVNNNTATASPKMTFGFINEATPSITNYNLMYASTFGQLPLARLWLFDAETGNFQEQSIRPTMVMVDSLIETITFDIGTEQTGFIILS